MGKETKIPHDINQKIKKGGWKRDGKAQERWRGRDTSEYICSYTSNFLEPWYYFTYSKYKPIIKTTQDMGEVKNAT